ACRFRPVKMAGPTRTVAPHDIFGMDAAPPSFPERGSVSALSSAATASLISASRLSVNGLATGLDTDKIIQGLLALQQKTIDNIQTKENRVLQQQQAFKGIEAR